jgi:manganese/zinc/iron transport system permease protein
LDAVWTITAAALVAVSCALLGCYLILRKMAMVGDAISHSILPGILFAFLLSGERNSLTMLIGASLFGVFTTFLIEFFHRQGKVQSDAAIGITFTSLFALGVILITAFAGQVDLDQDCVLYGEIAYVPLDVWITQGGTNMGPRVVWVMSIVLVLISIAIYLSYKELLLTTFDPAFAAAIGMSTSLWHYLLMSAVSVTTVAAFEAVGAILVVALLIAPAATAYLLTHNFFRMLLISAVLGILIAFCGYYLAVWLDGSIAGAMSTVAGIFFVGALFLSPENGLFWKIFRKKALQEG